MTTRCDCQRRICVCIKTFLVTHNLAFSARTSSRSSLKLTTLPTCSSSSRTCSGDQRGDETDDGFTRADRRRLLSTSTARIQRTSPCTGRSAYLLPLSVSRVVIGAAQEFKHLRGRPEHRGTVRSIGPASVGAILGKQADRRASASPDQRGSC